MPDSEASLVARDGLPPYFTFPLLERFPRLFHGFSTRLGGISPQPYHSLNLGLTTQDSPENVRQNRQRLEEATGHPLREWIRLEHGNRVQVVDDTAEPAVLPTADAVITAHAGVCLTVLYADCVPIVLYDAVTPAVGLVHAGWRGTVAEVAAATVAAMQQAFGSTPGNLWAGLGSSIGPCCMLVDSDVTSVVRARFPLWQDSVIHPKNSEKSTIDLWELNMFQLTRAGVPRQQIAISRLCTACREDLFFSYRRDRRQTGRLGMMAAIEDT